MPTPKSRPARSDAIAVLEKDHEAVRKLLKRLDEAKAAAPRKALYEKVRDEILIHSQIEEEIFYPAFRSAAEAKDDMKLFFEAKEEHHIVDVVLDEIAGGDPAGSPYAAKCKVLKDLVEHHAEEEEEEMFPKARKLMGKEALVDIGRRLATRKKELQALKASPLRPTGS
jgi:iron-sulfur cluster repair protein YtfE (RIC family)